MSANITSCTRLGSWQRPRAPAPSVGRDACSVAGAAVIGTDRDARGTRPAEIVAFTAIELMAALHYLRGTNVGGEPTEQHPRRRLPGPDRHSLHRGPPSRRAGGLRTRRTAQRAGPGVEGRGMEVSRTVRGGGKALAGRARRGQFRTPNQRTTLGRLEMDCQPRHSRASQGILSPVVDQNSRRSYTMTGRDDAKAAVLGRIREPLATAPPRGCPS